MTEQTFNLKGGVLIIGSLLWQDNVRGENTIRRDWRNERLDIDSTIGVKVPIRYGRISTGGIYTMIFANSCRGKNIGTAFAVPFQKNPITNLTQLMKEASELATAEGMSRTFISSNKGQPWCVLGILFNKSKIAHTDKVILSNWWLNELSQDDDFTRFNAENFKLGSERPCIYPNGLLSIPWVAPINNNDKNSLDQFDFLIATATLPSGDKYPSISKLYKAVKTDNDRKYFRNNFNNGITTFQDNRVNKKLTQ